MATLKSFKQLPQLTSGFQKELLSAIRNAWAYAQAHPKCQFEFVYFEFVQPVLDSHGLGYKPSEVISKSTDLRVLYILLNK